MLTLIIEDYPEDDIAEIYFSFRGRYFPDEHWTDFKRVLSMWHSALSEEGSGDRLWFMDGPFEFDVQKMDQDAYLFSFYHDSAGVSEPVMRHVATRVEYEALRRQLADIAKSH
jgi:hypothetical protein